MSYDLINSCLALLCLAVPWIVFRLLPKSFTRKPRIRAISVLLAFFYYMVILEAVQPRFSEGPVFNTLDYGLMCTVPIAAYIAGRFAPHFSHSFIFGAVCATLFTVASDSYILRFLWEIEDGPFRVQQLIAQWLLLTLSTGLACWFIALLPPRKKKPRPA